MTTISAKCILASVGEDAPPVFTMECVYPLAIHSEVMTNRCLSKNSASLRAIPTETVVKRLRADPFVPIVWGKNQKGMQAFDTTDEPVRVPRTDFIGRLFKLTELVDAETAWLRAMENAITFAEAFADANYHKQVQNRLLAPFLHNRVLVTGVSWQNFFDLRIHKDAEPHIHELAKAIKAEMERVVEAGEVVKLTAGQWHLPYVSSEDIAIYGLEDARKVSVARCARVSYNLADGRPTTFQEELALYDRLAGQVPVHASPTEHQLSPDKVIYYSPYDNRIFWADQKMHGNTPGWKQFRKMIPGETSVDQWQIDLAEKHKELKTGLIIN